MKRFDEQGFTITELIVVIAIMAILTAVAVPSYNKWSATLNQKNAAWNIASILKQARQTAVSGNLEYRVEFRISGLQYRLTRGDLPAGSTVWTEIKPWTDLPPGISLARGTGGVCDGTADINFVFNPRGSADQGIVCVRDSSGVTKYSVKISPVNGRVFIQ